MKKSVLALLLLAVLIIIVSPGIVGKLAEESVGDNLTWAARNNATITVTSDGFDRGWFSSEGRHRVTLGEGEIRSAIVALTGKTSSDELPVLVITTHLDHGLIPVTSMARAEGSLTPGLGSAASTLAIEYGSGERIEVPGAVYSEIGLSGDLDSRYIVAAGAQAVDGGEITWQASTVSIASDASTGRLEFSGDIGALTFGNDQQVVTIDGLSFGGGQTRSPYGFNVGDIDLTMGAVSSDAAALSSGGLRGLSVKASSSVDDGLAAAALRFEINGQTIPGLGEISVTADTRLSGLDATALGAVSMRIEESAAALTPEQLLLAAEQELMDLVAAGFGIGIEQFDIALPMGTVEMRMTIEVPAADRSEFTWSSLLLNTVASLNVSVPETLVQLASSMNPQAGAIIGMGYLRKKGDVYLLDADLRKGLLKINGAPVPLPLGALQ